MYVWKSCNFRRVVIIVFCKIVLYEVILFFLILNGIVLIINFKCVEELEFELMIVLDFVFFLRVIVMDEDVLYEVYDNIVVEE